MMPGSFQIRDVSGFSTNHGTPCSCAHWQKATVMEASKFPSSTFRLSLSLRFFSP